MHTTDEGIHVGADEGGFDADRREIHKQRLRDVERGAAFADDGIANDQVDVTQLSVEDTTKRIKACETALALHTVDIHGHLHTVHSSTPHNVHAYM